MEETRYELYGYVNRWPNKEFVFLTPLYRWENLIYRSEIDEVSDGITDFSLMDGAFSVYDPKDAADYARKVGERAVYMYSFRGEIFCGERHDVCVQLMLLMRYVGVRPLDRYDMFYFMGIPRGIEDSLDEAVRELNGRGIGIAKKNFLRPWDVRIDVEHLAMCMRHYALLISAKGCFLSIDSFQTPGAKADGLFRFGRFVIDKTELEGRFDELIGMDPSPIYKDLVVCSFLMNDATAYATGSHEFRFRLRPPIGPVSEDRPEVMEILYQNSQSDVPIGVNALECAAEVRARIENHHEAAPRANRTRHMDTAQTFAAAKKIKERV